MVLPKITRDHYSNVFSVAYKTVKLYLFHLAKKLSTFLKLVIKFQHKKEPSCISFKNNFGTNGPPNVWGNSKRITMKWNRCSLQGIQTTLGLGHRRIMVRLLT